MCAKHCIPHFPQSGPVSNKVSKQVNTCEVFLGATYQNSPKQKKTLSGLDLQIRLFSSVAWTGVEERWQIVPYLRASGG